MLLFLMSFLDSTTDVEFTLIQKEDEKMNISIPKRFFYFSLPYLFSYFLQTLYGMADLFIIGQFGLAADTTAVAIGSQVMHMLTVMLVGLSMGTTVCIAQSVGAGKDREVSKYIGNTLILFSGIAILSVGVLLLCLHGIVSIMSTPAEAVSGTQAYLKVCFIGIPFIIAYNIVSSIFRGLGDSRTPMYFIAVACVVNIVLDYVFMGYFHIGPIGAALGTVLAQAVSVILAIFTICKKKLVRVSLQDMHPDQKHMTALLKVGFPICIQDGFIQVGFLFITIIANQRGVLDSAAVGIVEKIISFLFLVPSTLLSTTSSLGAQYVGACQEENCTSVLKYSLGIAVVFGLTLSILTQFTAQNVVSLFTKDAEVALAGASYFRGYILDCFFAGIHFSFSGYFCAHGKSLYSFIHNSISLMTVRVPGVYLASKVFPSSLLPMGLATACGSFVSVVICLIFFRRMQKQV